MKNTSPKRILKKMFFIILGLFILLNLWVALQAYRFTHFDENAPQLPPNPKDIQISTCEKIKIAAFGLKLPKPITRKYPDRTYTSATIPYKNEQKLRLWLMPTDSLPKGTVLIFHGYMDEKSSMLDRAKSLLDMGYNIVLSDFIGAGDSDGTQVTIGNNEAEQVKIVYDHIMKQIDNDNIYLMGFSMGAVAIIKAQHDYNMIVNGIILEAPYSSLEETIGRRIDQINGIRTPFMQLTTFWMGIENGFDGFSFQPIEFVKQIQSPTLLLCGGKDSHIPISESQDIFENIGSEIKEFHVFDDSEHESYLKKYPEEWRNIINTFLGNIEEKNVFYDTEPE